MCIKTKSMASAMWGLQVKFRRKDGEMAWVITHAGGKTHGFNREDDSPPS